MKGKLGILTVMALGLFALNVAQAADTPYGQLAQPTSIQKTVFAPLASAPRLVPAQTVSYEAQASEAKSCNACDKVECCEATCDSCCGWSLKNSLSCLSLPCCKGPTWELRTPCALKCRGIETGGWMSAGIYSNGYGAKDNGPITLRDYGNGFTADQMWFYMEKEADNGGCGIAWGGRADFVWGADGPDLQASNDNGWDTGWNTSDDDNYGSSLPQLYAELAVNQWKIKAGHFFSLLGYESVPAVNNFFYSHSYALANEPYTHMGVLASRNLTNRLEVTGGWVNGWDNGWLNPTGASGYLGSAKYKLSRNTSLTYALTGGSDMSVAMPGNSYMHSLVFDWNINCRWEYVMQSNFATCDESGIANQANQHYGISQYLFYKINDCWKFGTRIEWFRMEDYYPAADTETSNATALSVGLNYRPLPNVRIRPELRWDWSDASNISPNVFDNDTKSNQVSGGFDFIVTF